MYLTFKKKQKQKQKNQKKNNQKHKTNNFFFKKKKKTIIKLNQIKPMRSSFSMGVRPHKFRITLLPLSLSLILSNPLSRLSILLKIGTSSVESQKYKTLKEIQFLEEKIVLETILYQDKKGLYQEKMAILDILQTNSRLASSIGCFKLDLGNLANGNNSSSLKNGDAKSFNSIGKNGDGGSLSHGNIGLKNGFLQKSFDVNLEKSIEYQGRIKFLVKMELLEENPNLSVCEDTKSQRSQKSRSFTPIRRAGTPNASASNKLKGAIIDVLGGNKITRIFKENSKITGNATKIENLMNIFANPTNLTGAEKNEKREDHLEFEEIRLEKMLNVLTLEKTQAEAKVNEKNINIKEKEKLSDELNGKIKTFQSENEELLKEINEIKRELGSIDRKRTENNIVNSEVYQIQKEIQKFEEQLENINLKKIQNEVAMKYTKQKCEEHDKNINKLREKLKETEFSASFQTHLYEELKKDYEKFQDEKKGIVSENNKKFDISEFERRILKNEQRLNEKSNIVQVLICKNQELDQILILHKKPSEESEKNNVELKKKLSETEQELNNLRTINSKLNESTNDKKKELEETQEKWIKYKQQTADLMNLIFEKGTPEILEAMDGVLTGT